MLARTYGPRYDRWPCYCQPKLNGVRALYQHGQGTFWTFQSRDEKTWNMEVLQHIGHELEQFDTGNLILDGELYVHGWRLQRINGSVAVNRHAPTEDTLAVQFHVFDVVDPNRSFSARRFELYHTLREAELPHVCAVPTGLIQNAGEMQMHFNNYVALGYEGIMLRPDGPYEFGEHTARSGPERMTQYRSQHLLKHKHFDDAEFRCVGVTQGEGKADIGIGALVLQAPANSFNPDDHFTFNVGTGFTDEERIEFSRNPPVGRLVRVRYLCLSADGIPLNPSFIALM